MLQTAADGKNLHKSHNNQTLTESALLAIYVLEAADGDLLLSISSSAATKFLPDTRKQMSISLLKVA